LISYDSLFFIGPHISLGPKPVDPLSSLLGHLHCLSIVWAGGFRPFVHFLPIHGALSAPASPVPRPSSRLCPGQYAWQIAGLGRRSSTPQIHTYACEFSAFPRRARGRCLAVRMSASAARSPMCLCVLRELLFLLLLLLLKAWLST